MMPMKNITVTVFKYEFSSSDSQDEKTTLNPVRDAHTSVLIDSNRLYCWNCLALEL